MSAFEYTDHHFSEASSAIDDVYYNEKTQELVIETYSGSLAGYYGVPREVYDAFVLEDTARAYGGSLGGYWNTIIKPNFKGFSTSYISNFKQLDTTPVLNETFVFQTEEVEVPEATRSEYTITFSNDDYRDNEIVVFAASNDAVLVAFGKIADIAGWSNYKITALTQHFA